MCEYNVKNTIWGHFLKGAKKESELILKNDIMQFEFAFKVGSINECRLNKITVGAYFFKIFEKISFIWDIRTPLKDFHGPAPWGGKPS